MFTTHTSIVRRAVAGALALAGIAGLSGVVDAGEPVRDDRLTSTERRTVHQATKQFRDLDVALAAGYVPAGECASHPDLGGMGYHYLHPALAGDTVVDPTMPEILVYVPGDDGLKLGAVEWFVADADQDLGTDGDRPTLFDRLPFDGPMPGHEPGMPVHYDLHVWLYDHNPAGQLAPFNPKVTCPTGDL